MYGLKLMFLFGIVPITGSLAIPMNDQSYEDCENMFPATMFRFDYSGRSITVPVQAGSMAFQYGSQLTGTVEFPSAGVYQITFSDDWNNVTSSTKISDLNNNFQYLDSGNPAPADIAITNLTVAKSVIGQGNLATVNVTFNSQDVNNETLNFTVCANSTTIYSQPITIVAASNSTVGFEWNTTGFSYGNYTLNAYVEPLPDEINVANNNFTCNSSVHIGIQGDISGFTPGVPDGVCNMRDISYLIVRFNTRLGSLNWNPNCDIDNSGRVDMKDIVIAVMNFDKHE